MRAAEPRMRVVAAILFACAALAGCSAAEFYWQGLLGQFDLLRRAQPIDDVLAQSDDARLKSRLELARELRLFASRALALPANGSYTRYTDLGRPFVAWNVFAAPPLSLAPREWCFPVAGCVNYRGYFDEATARAEAELFRIAGDDVYVSGVPAYSTLGWFDDPLLSSFVRFPDTDLARLLFHELAHQVVYVKDDSQFNESFAVAVEEEGVRRWIGAQAGGPDQMRLAAEFARGERLRKRFRELVVATREQLAAIYASDANDVDKLRAKAEALAEMRTAYEQARAGETGLAGYDRWFAGYANAGPNNASLVAVTLYTGQVPAFRALLAQSRGDLPAFYEQVKVLAAMSKAQRDDALVALAASEAVANAPR